MARITVEDCLKQVNNRFTLIHMAAKRVRQLRKGADPTIESKNKDIVVALREIAAGNVIQGEPGSAAALLETGVDLPEETLPAEAQPEPGKEADKAAGEEEVSEGQ